MNHDIMNNTELQIYVIIGTRENVSQDEIGGPFVPHPTDELITAFCSETRAQEFISSQRLSQKKSRPRSDTAYYKNGYYDMKYESIFVEDIHNSHET